MYADVVRGSLKLWVPRDLFMNFRDSEKLQVYQLELSLSYELMTLD